MRVFHVGLLSFLCLSLGFDWDTGTGLALQVGDQGLQWGGKRWELVRSRVTQVGDSHNMAGNRDVNLRLKQESEPPGRLVKTQGAGPHPRVSD